eukprot:GGOE01010630.1.p1 GENE.GGOE01010630.1~~GGOE01010630.1.p1  ORF type:complete len:599 (-),score=133.86 GGOE01010630.1:932-2728(-)
MPHAVLHHCAQPCCCKPSGDVEEVLRLLQAGCRIDERDANAETSLCLACRNGHAAVARQLVEAGATVDAINLVGETPLFAACDNGHMEVIQLLLARQATLDYPAHHGMTPLMAAARAGCLEAVMTLMEHGATASLTSEEGKTASAYAAQYGHDVIASFLEFHDVQLTRSFSSLTHDKSSVCSMKSFNSVPSEPLHSPRSPTSSFHPRHSPEGHTVPLGDILQCIRTAARQCAPAVLLPEHFQSSACTRMTVKLKDGTEMKMREFLPKVHAKIREICAVDGGSFADAWDLPAEKLTLTIGAGRSGSLFAHSNDGRYIMKTIPYDEVMTYVERCQAYYHHLKTQPDCLIMRIYGLYRFHSSWGTCYVLLSGNVLHCCTLTQDSKELPLVVFDLKGRVPKPGKLFQRQGERGVVWKDKDLERFFWLDDAARSSFLQQLHADVDWLQTQNMMDYSLLIGVRPLPTDPRNQALWDTEIEATAHGFTGCAFRRHLGGLRSATGEVYYIGIIDCLTNYSGKKVVANLCKSMIWKGAQLSTVPSETYAARFYTFMESIFPPQHRLSDPTLGPSHPNAPYALRDGFDVKAVFGAGMANRPPERVSPG